MKPENAAMDSVLHVLTELASRPLGTLVYLGADSAALEEVLRLPAQRLVLVQGDPDEAIEMQRLGALTGARLQVIESATMPQAGEVRWHRYNVSALNGPLDASSLVRNYPRLRQAGVLSVLARPLTDLLDEAAQDSTDVPDVLVMDLPGQELGLLESLRPCQLDRFQAVVVRACGTRIDNPWCTAAQTQEFLAQRSWQLVATASPQDSLWPVLLFRFDEQAHQQRLRDKRLAELEVLADELGRHLDQARAEQAQAVAASHAEQTRLATEAQQLQRQLLQERQAQVELRQVAEQLTQERDRAVAQAESQARRIEEAESVRAVLEDRNAQSTADLAALTIRLTEAERAAERSRAEVAHANEAVLGHDSEVQRMRDALARANEDLQHAVAERARMQAEADTSRAQLVQQLAELRAERDTLQKTADHRAGRLREGDAALSGLRQSVASLEAKLQAAEAEARQQATLQADATALAAKHRTQADAAEKARQQLDVQTKSLLGQIETGKAEIAKLTSERDAARKTAVERERQQSTLEREVLDLRQRLDLMHQELSKAEGQLELLRELILQEPSL